MQTFHEAVGAVETFSPAESILQPLSHRGPVPRADGVCVLLFAPFELPILAHRMAAIMGLVVTPDHRAAAGRDGDPGHAFAVLGITGSCGAGPFADPIIFLFIGGFMLAQAMFVHNDRRVAYGALAMPGVGSSATRSCWSTAASARRCRCGSAIPRPPP